MRFPEIPPQTAKTGGEGGKKTERDTQKILPKEQKTTKREETYTPEFLSKKST